ncbi:MAG TPA: hypothetical protein VGL02_03015 [Streptomyces sp.]|uniref:Secreted protein n=1 Tax=Amycolatopsis nalaikhensis TaxID=715472 RepID=A0ABY8XEL3_9PSEU|nr:hypothetical protein [Amycolatopsis sp. 2-2]WIV54048.1 hypothetical protein QP939_34980 [Amycolatopsis sp. 2-2]
MNGFPKNGRGLARAAGVAALTLAGSVTLAVGSAEASVWRCGGQWCSSAVANAPVYQYIGGPYFYTIPQGAIVEINCYFDDSASGIWYLANRPGYREGVVHGNNLATGHDPNPNIAPCV